MAFKPGCNYVTVDHITCSGSHGLSVGSLGKGAGSTDTVKNVRVTNAIMKTSAKALGIKLYPGGSAHGSPVVTNVTFSGVDVQSSDYAVQIQSCYGETEDYCTSNPSTGSISGVVFENISGTTSSKYDPVVANLNCPPKGSCGIKFTGFTVKAPSGKATVLCDSKVSNAGVTCTSGATG